MPGYQDPRAPPNIGHVVPRFGRRLNHWQQISEHAAADEPAKAAWRRFLRAESANGR